MHLEDHLLPWLTGSLGLSRPHRDLAVHSGNGKPLPVSAHRQVAYAQEPTFYLEMVKVVVIALRIGAWVHKGDLTAVIAKSKRLAIEVDAYSSYWLRNHR